MVNNFNLVIYTDDNTAQYINIKGNPKIKIVIKPFEQFHNFKYINSWIENHKRNFLLNDKSNWVLNMLWSEKIWFVKETIERKYYETEFYGWCDIGYFRNRPDDIHTNKLMNWPNSEKIMKLDKNKICYACINNDDRYMNYLHNLINNKKSFKLERIQSTNMI